MPRLPSHFPDQPAHAPDTDELARNEDAIDMDTILHALAEAIDPERLARLQS